MTLSLGESSSRTSKPRLLLVALVFVASRLFVLPFPQPTSDVGIYAAYAHEHEAACREGLPFYDFHARAVQEQIDAARAAGTPTGSMEENRIVEYPPLAIAIMRLPTFVMTQGAGPGPPSQAFEQEYRTVYRRSMAIADAILFIVLVVLVRRVFASESGAAQETRLLFYVAATIALWHLLYDRLDLVLAAVIVLALALLVSRRHHAWSFAVLALGIHFKLVPIVLAPVWMVGSLPADLPWYRSRGLAALAARAVLLMGMTLLCFVPFYLSSGTRGLGFLDYHRARGLEVGAVPASLPLTLQAAGHAVHIDYSYKSINLHSALTPVLAAAAPGAAAVLFLGATILLLAHARHLQSRPADPSLAAPTLAQLYPRVFVAYTLLFLALFIVTSKVFSPQYLLWLAPFVALHPFAERTSRRSFVTTFLLVCILSTVLVPFLFVADLVDLSVPPSLTLRLRGLTARVSAIIVVRNVLFLGMTGALAVYLLRQASGPGRASAGAAPADSPPA